MRQINQQRRRSAFESLETRQHLAVDLLIADLEFNQQTSPLRTDSRGHLTGQIIVQNGGTTTSSTSWVSLYLEDGPGAGAGARKQLMTANVGALRFGQTATIPFDVVMPNMPSWDLDDNDMYIAAYADDAHQNNESNESNNSYRGEGADYIRFRGEENLTVLPGAGGSSNAAPYTKYEFFPWAGKLGDEPAGTYDMDTFAIDLDRGQSLEIGVTETFNSALRIYDANWNLVAKNDDRPGEANPQNPFIQMYTAAGGRFYAVVSGAANQSADPFSLNGRVEGATGDYTLYERVYTPSTVSVAGNTFGTLWENYSGGSNGGFYLTRTGDTRHALTVNFDTSGTALPGADVTISQAVFPAGVSQAYVQLTANTDTIEEQPEYLQLTVHGDNLAYFAGSPATYTLVVRDNPIQVGPRGTSAGFLYDDTAGMRLYMTFDDQITGFDENDITLTNLTTGQTIVDKRGLASVNGDTGILFFDHGLPDGNYRANFKAGGVTNSHGGANREYSFDFFHLNGDANHDRKVDFADLVTLASNYNKSGMVWHDGDFTGDGKVNFNDLVILAGRYNKQLVPALALSSTFGTTPISDGEPSTRESRRSRITLPRGG